jgi:putative membrane protein
MKKKISAENQWIILLLLFYFFGLLGIAFEAYQYLFLPLTPLNLLLTLIVFYKVNGDYSLKFIMLSIIIFSAGFAIEAVGVATGVLFGNYNYGPVFGFKLFETPLMIGVNWLFLALGTYGVVQYFTQKTAYLLSIPPLLMTALDFLVEPIAMKLNFWNWDNDIIPPQNYLMWFITSFLIHSIMHLFSPTINAKISFVVISIQFLFFGILNSILT